MIAYKSTHAEDTMQIVFEARFPAEVKKEEDYYVSCCPVLDVWSQGPTKRKALENLTEAVQLFLISCFERGTLDEVLRDCGFTAYKKIPKPRPFPSRYESIRVPLPFQTSGKVASHCPA